MDDNTKYAWLVGSLISFAAWLVVFATLKGSKKKLLLVSLTMAAVGIFLNLVAWTVDWWRPTTITGTRIGAEDIIFGLAIGGIGSVFYEWFFGLKTPTKQRGLAIPGFISLVVLPIIVAACSSHLFSFSSFYGWLVAVVLPIAWMLYKRLDLIKPALFTSTAFVVAAIAGFWALNQYDPIFVDSTWQFDNLTGWMVLGVPFEDIIWFYTIGAYLAIIHPFLFDYRFKKSKSS